MASLVVLGSGTGIPTSRRSSPGLLLKTKEGVLLIDPGPGALNRMTAFNTAVEEVGQVLITHHHPDHTLDIMALLFARRNPWLAPHLENLTLIGPKGTRDLHARMINLYGDWIRSDETKLEIVEVSRGPFPSCLKLDGTAYETDHIEGALGYRLILGSATVAISGDTGPCDTLVDLGREADLFLLECAIPDDYPAMAGHMNPSSAGHIASRANPKKLVLYHLYPPVDADEAFHSVRGSFKGDVCIAEDGAVFEV